MAATALLYTATAAATTATSTATATTAASVATLDRDWSAHQRVHILRARRRRGRLCRAGAGARAQRQHDRDKGRGGDRGSWISRGGGICRYKETPQVGVAWVQVNIPGLFPRLLADGQEGSQSSLRAGAATSHGAASEAEVACVHGACGPGKETQPAPPSAVLV